MKKITFWTLVWCLAATASFGQINNATLTGTVSDASGAVLPGVSITATNNATGVVSTVVSNEAGAYNIQSELPGTYTVTADLQGFTQLNNQTITLNTA